MHVLQCYVYSPPVHTFLYIHMYVSGYILTSIFEVLLKPHEAWKLRRRRLFARLKARNWSQPIGITTDMPKIAHNPIRTYYVKSCILRYSFVCACYTERVPTEPTYRKLNLYIQHKACYFRDIFAVSMLCFDSLTCRNDMKAINEPG